jgi:hypothetical protein
MDRQEVERVIREVDANEPSPDQRALRLWHKVKDEDAYDILCFAVNFTAVLLAELPFLKTHIVALNKALWHYHYFTRQRNAVPTNGSVNQSGEGTTGQVDDKPVSPSSNIPNT